MESFFFVLAGACLLAVLILARLIFWARAWPGLEKIYILAAWWTLPLAVPFLYGNSSGPRLSGLPWIHWPALWNAAALVRTYCGVFALLVGAALLIRAYLKKQSWVPLALASFAMALPYLFLGWKT